EELDREAHRQGRGEHELRDADAECGELPGAVEDGCVALVRLVENGRGGREAHVRRHLVADGLEGTEDDLGGDGVGGGGAPGAGGARPRRGLARARAEGAQGLRARGEGHGVWLHRSAGSDKGGAAGGGRRTRGGVPQLATAAAGTAAA